MILKGRTFVLCLLLNSVLLSSFIIGTADPEVIDGYSNKSICYEFEKTPATFRVDVIKTDERQTIEQTFLQSLKNGFFQPELYSGPMDSSWPMQSHDVHHTGRSPHSTEHILGSEKWRFITEGPIVGGLSIATDGTMYFGTNNWYIYALNPNGTLKWRFKIENTIRSTPAIAEDGTIYIGSWDCKLYALSPNGSLKWKFSTGGSIDGSPAIAQDGTIYITTLGSGLYAVNPNETVKWHYPHGESYSDPAIGDDGTIYYGDFYSATIYAVNPNGTEKWNFTARLNIRGSPSIADDGTVYMEAGGELYALNPENGSVIWKTSVGLTNSCPAIDTNGVIYVGEGSGRLDQFYAYYPNGTVKWSFDPGNNSGFWKSSAAVSADGTIYVGTNYDYPNGKGGEIIALNSDDGSVRWRKLITSLGWVDSSPCIGADGTVYVGSWQQRQFKDDNSWKPIGYVHAFGPVASNEPPSTPVIKGNPIGNIKQEYFYNISAIDPDLNPVSFSINWGDNTTTHSEQYASNEKAFIGHTYTDTGTYTIRVMAVDEFGGESDWETLEITMPKTHTYNPMIQLILKLSEQFPLLQSCLNL